MKVTAAAALAMVVFPTTTVLGIDNGIGVTPPRGWRSWNQFQCAINQTMIEAQYEAMVDRSRQVNGKNMSLVDVGYLTAGIDDCWQQCNSGPGGVGFHNASGYPNVNKDLFPDMAAMAARAKSLGLKPGWYGNNCDCSEQRPDCRYDPSSGKDSPCFLGDVQATIDFGFESIKLDGCGIERNITRYSELFNATGVPVMLENCHNGNPTYPTRDPATGKVDCPMNFFRSSGDIRPTFGSVLNNLESTTNYNGPGLTGPGCWAYPYYLRIYSSTLNLGTFSNHHCNDMLEVGVTNSQHTAQGCVDGVPSEGCTLNLVEAQTHFNAWCIVSAPLVLGFDLTDTKTLNEVWPIITNQEAMEVNQDWAGDAGNLILADSRTVHMTNCSWDPTAECDHPSWMVWRKNLTAKGGPRTALLLMNNDDVSQDVSIDWTTAGIACPATGCDVRDLDAHADLGAFKDKFHATLQSHASAFVVVSAASAKDQSSKFV